MKCVLKNSLVKEEMTGRLILIVTADRGDDHFVLEGGFPKIRDYCHVFVYSDE